VATQHYDAVVIGSGQGGNPLARAFADAGRKTALIEREHVGGTCINEGCTPTKTMVASARVAYLDRRSADYGVEDGSVALDMARVRRRKDDVVQSFRASNEKRLEDSGVDLIRGEACFTGPKELEVRLAEPEGEAINLSAENVFINVGARPGGAPIDGLDEVPTLNSTTIMELDVVPDHLLVLGGGYVGLEFAQMFRRFGAEVTVI
jgi:pyruvate/2-oxoglutarate dehydrogenase complex dihydrolipoamide dehydrogenase (E3) component